MYALSDVLSSGILAALHSIGLFDSGLKEHVSRRRFACARLELCAATLVQMVAQLLPQSQPRYAPADGMARCAFGSLISSPRTRCRLLCVFQRVLFCTTLKGKSAIVRHIEPNLCIDDDRAMLLALKPFIDQVVHIETGSQSDSAASSSSSSSSSSPPAAAVPSFPSLTHCYLPQQQKEQAATRQ